MLKNKYKLSLLLITFGLFSAQVVNSEGFTNVFTVTAYCSCTTCCGKWSKYNTTACGAKPKQGITCAASRKIPFGTKLKIENIGIRIVQDRLAQKYDSRIDLYFNSHKEALKFGKKKLKVEIVK